jgi:acyl-CoA thioester hydrolase
VHATHPPLTDAAAHAVRLPFQFGMLVQPEWIDANGHMNVGYYAVAFDRAFDAFSDQLGLGPDGARQRGRAIFVVESHMCYLRELLLGNPLLITWQLLACDTKRIHYVMTMSHAEDGFVAATSEQLGVYVDLGSRHAIDMSDAQLGTLRAVAKEHASVRVPEQVGRMIAMRR